MLLSDYKKRLKESFLSLPDKEKNAAMRYLARTDLYYLLRYVLRRKDMERQWLFDRCMEVQSEPNNHLDLWAREFYKSTIITYGKSIQDILSSHGEDPLPEWNGTEVTIGIFSHTRPIAKGFLRQIKIELESNNVLKDLFPDVLFQNPSKESPKWSEDDGLIVKRKSNPKESTVETWGLVDSQPTSKHFFIRVYDDVVTKDSVTSPEMIKKTTDAWELSSNLGASGGLARYIGTRFHYNDTYSEIIKRGTVTVRKYAVTANGKLDGEPVLISIEEMERKRKEQGDYTFSCQMLLDPKAVGADGFNEEWLRYTSYNDGHGMNIYILVDPANEKQKRSDYTVMAVVGLGQDGNYYLLDGIRDKLNLTERYNALIRLHREWNPLKVGYERYGMQADIEFIKLEQERDNYRFDIVELGGRLGKNERIKRLIGPFETGKFYLPATLRKTNYEGRGYDFVQEFIGEYKAFPFLGSGHDDVLDSTSRIMDPDLKAVFPRSKEQKRTSRPVKQNNRYNPHRLHERSA